MPSIKASFTLYTRPRTNGKPVWYYQTYNEQGRRLPGRSTGTSSKAEARLYCENLLKTGRLSAPKVPTLAAWVAERHWYEWPRDSEEPLCSYAQGRLARSSKDKPAVGHRHIDDCHAHLRDHILPSFGSKRLDDITPSDLEKWIFSLIDHFAAKTVNNIATAFRNITAEASRLQLIDDDPWKRVQLFVNDPKPKGVLTTKEAIQLLDPKTTEVVWNNNQAYYLIGASGFMVGNAQKC